MSPEFLTLPDLVAKAAALGLDVSDRTVRFYVSKGLLPAPVKSPFEGADGRVAWFPAHALRRLRRIAQLKAQGLTLEQIGRSLEGRRGPTPDEGPSREFAFRYLQAEGTDVARRARLEFLAAVTGTRRDDLLVRAARTYLQRRLAPLVGEDEAHRHVEEFLLGLSPAELERRLEPFRRWRDAEAERERTTRPSPTMALRRLAGDRLLGLVDASEFQRRLRDLRQAAATAGRPLRDPCPPGGEILARGAARAMDLLREGLDALQRAEDAQAMASALAIVERGETLLQRTGDLARRQAALLEDV